VRIGSTLPDTETERAIRPLATGCVSTGTI
jgi:hypothetical protein